jgi:hypothetical protein
MQCTMQMQCTLTEVQLSEVKMWTIAEYCRLGDEAERRGKGKTKLGVKQKPWWDFIPITHYMVPLLHCMIGVGNQLLDMLRDIFKEHLENMTHTEERIRASIPLLKKIIAETAVNRNSFDDSDDGKLLKKLKRNVTLHSPSSQFQKPLQPTIPPPLPSPLPPTSHPQPPPTPTPTPTPTTPTPRQMK